MPRKTHKFELSTETVTLIEDLKKALEEEMQEHRDEWDAKSEKWQEDDKGVNVDAWIDSFGSLLDDLDSYEVEPDE